jgi:hypothetical protein
MHRKAIVLTAPLATAIALAACGGTSPSHGNQTASNSSSGNGVGLKLAHCMRTHGVPDFPDPSSGGGFQTSLSGSSSGSASVTVNGHTLNIRGPAFQKAMQECRSKMPQGPPISGAQLAQIKQGALKMAQCMRTHGVPNFPDPNVTSGPGGHGIAVMIGGPPGSKSGPRVFDPRSPAFQRAQASCQHFMGKMGPPASRTAKAG